MITCRRLGAEDVAIWRPLRQEALRDFPSAFLTSLAEEVARSDAEVAGQLSLGCSYAAFDGDTAIGIAALLPLRRMQTSHRGEIGAFFVTQSAHGTGAANALMAHLCDVAEEAGIWQLELFVARSNVRARRFYERNGFVSVGCLPNATFIDGEPVSDDFLIRHLPNAPKTADYRN